MGRALGLLGALLVVAWAVAHVLYLGPVRDVAEFLLAWTMGLLAASAVVAALSMLGFGLLAGASRPAWLRFVQWARTATAVVGGGLVVVGLVHYRDTEPRGEIGWLILGLGVLAGAGLVHLWVLRARRRVF